MQAICKGVENRELKREITHTTDTGIENNTQERVANEKRKKATQSEDCAAKIPIYNISRGSY
jgi:hypothetical protein